MTANRFFSQGIIKGVKWKQNFNLSLFNILCKNKIFMYSSWIYNVDDLLFIFGILQSIDLLILDGAVIVYKMKNQHGFEETY